MKKVAKFEFPATTSFGQSTHDWDAILAAEVAPEKLGKPGAAICLTHGEDFKGEPELFVSSIRTAAMKRHLLVKCKVMKEAGKPTLIYVQTAKMNDEQIADADAKLEHQKEVNKARTEKKKAEKQTAGTVPTLTTATA